MGAISERGTRPQPVPIWVTMLRFALSPLFLAIYFAPNWLFGLRAQPLLFTLILWVLFIIIEVSDIVDGWLARSRNQITNTGALLDPTADVCSRLTYFTCFLITGFIPIWCFAIILYREICAITLRMVGAVHGTMISARYGGKLKSLFYSLASAVTLFLIGMRANGWLLSYTATVRQIVFVLFSAAALLAVLSFIEYLARNWRFLRSLRYEKPVDQS